MKATIKDNVPVAEAALVKSAPDGRVLDIAFTRNSIFGTFDGYEIEGARNLLASKAKDDAKAAAEAALNRLIGNYVLAYGDELGYSGLTVSIMKKGKVKVSGKLANGMSVSTASQLITGEDYCCIPVVYTKKGTSLAFSIYFPNEGGDPVVFGYYDAMVSPVAGLGSGVSFFVGEALYDLFADYSLLDEFLPCGVSVAQNVSSPDTASVQDSEAERLRAKLRSLASMGDEKPERI